MKDIQAIRIHMHDNAHRIETIKQFMKNNKGADKRECDRNIFILEEVNKALSEIQQYLSVGTVEECRVAVEKMKLESKNPIGEIMKFHNKTYPCKKQAEMREAKPNALAELNRGDSP